MIIKEETFNDINTDLSIIGIESPDKAIFLDIETTGLSSRNSTIYMIGLSHIIDNKWVFTGLFAESPANEEEILIELSKILGSYETIIHFNGSRFDIPFIKDRNKCYNLTLDFENYNSIDLYKRINSFKHLIGVGNCKQKTIESFLGINRLDEYNGGQLIEVYKDYVESKDDALFHLLYQHNHDDLLGMLEILPVFVYEKLTEIIPSLDTISENEYVDFNGCVKIELMAEYTLPFSLPSPVSINNNGVFLSMQKNRGYLRIPLIYSEMKHYFTDYKNYFYLPKEDMAIHKSVSSFVDKEYRQKATEENCYIRKEGTFIPSYISIDHIAFKTEYSSKCEYIEYNDSVSNDSMLMENYFNTFLCTAYQKR